MNRPIRIGLIAEGEAELGPSIPYIKPEDGGKIIERSEEGALHTLIRRELEKLGLLECHFIQRHPSISEGRVFKRRTGHSVLELKYLAQIVISWKPEEVDMIVIVVDSDDNYTQRQRDLQQALITIRNNHLDASSQVIQDRSTGGLAIKNFETWLLADTQTISKNLGVEIEALDSLESLENTKSILDSAILKSTYLSEDTSNQRPLRVRWNIAHQIDLTVIKTCCPNGYATFVKNLETVAKITQGASFI